MEMRGASSRSGVQKQFKKLILSGQNERHSYEKCQYEEFKKRVAKMDEIRASKEGARSN
jgi:NADH-ubiquinone oxidoreductase B18 subunit (NDUFB7)